MAVSKTLRFEILRRDGFKCRYCGVTPAETEIQIDHVVPVTLGGTDEPTNLVAACFDCNAGKGKIAPDAPTVEDVAADALRWSAAMREAGERIAADTARVNSVLNAFDVAWGQWTYGPNKDLTPRPDDWRESIKKFVSAGIHGAALADAIMVAMNSHVPVDETWRYFCGVCWRKISDQQAVARTIVNEAGVA